MLAGARDLLQKNLSQGLDLPVVDHLVTPLAYLLPPVRRTGLHLNRALRPDARDIRRRGNGGVQWRFSPLVCTLMCRLMHARLIVSVGITRLLTDERFPLFDHELFRRHQLHVWQQCCGAFGPCTNLADVLSCAVGEVGRRRFEIQDIGLPDSVCVRLSSRMLMVGSRLRRRKACTSGSSTNASAVCDLVGAISEGQIDLCPSGMWRGYCLLV